MIKFEINGELYTSEQYKKDLIRYWDSLRHDLPGSLGLASCSGGVCRQCILHDTCVDPDDIDKSDKYYSFDNVLKIYKWAKDHPDLRVTNRDKVREVFGEGGLYKLLEINYKYNKDIKKFELDSELENWLNDEYEGENNKRNDKKEKNNGSKEM